MNNAGKVSSAQANQQPAVVMTPGKGFLVLCAVIVVVGAFLALTHGLGVTEVWAAFLFLLYWAGLEHANLGKLADCIVGAAVGLLMGYLLQTLPAILDATGSMLFLAAVVILVYCQIMGWLTVAVNMATMLYLTVTTIAPIQASVNFSDAAIALSAGVTYFASLVWAGHLWQKRGSRA